MGSTVSRKHGAGVDTDLGRARLYVAWQDPTSRSIEPVARLDRIPEDGKVIYEFCYLRRALKLSGFRPFLSFPDLRRVYRSAYLFPFFENRLVARGRDDYPALMRMLGLSQDADPFEVLARSEGRRQTDTIEVFPAPAYEGNAVRCHFVVHGIRHVPGAQEVLDSLDLGEHLLALPDPQNPEDRQAVLLRDGQCHVLGWMPPYLTRLVHLPLEHCGPDAMVIRVEHVGARDVPVHLRLLCGLRAEWHRTWDPPLAGPEFADVSAQ